MRYLGSIVIGLLITLIVLIISVSLAALIFSGDLSSHLSHGIGMALFAAAVSGAFFALFSSSDNVVAIPSDRIAALAAIMSGTVVATMPPATDSAVLAVVVAITIAISTVLTGVFLLLIGHFKFGGLIKFMPVSVIGGFMAGTGWLLVAGAFKVATDLPLQSWHGWSELTTAESYLKWLPAFMLAVLLYLSTEQKRWPLALPALIVIATACFFLVPLMMGVSIEQLRANGWLLGPFSDHISLPWKVFSDWELAFDAWPAIQANLFNMGTILVISVISVMMTVGALELMLWKDLEVNQELRTAGFANIVLGCFGGMATLHSLSTSTLTHRLGANARFVGLSTAIICIIIYGNGLELLGYLPKPILSGVLMFLGLSFLIEWVVKSWFRLPRAEYFLVLVILIIMIWAGFLAGMLVGLIIAVLLFVVSYSQVGAIRHILTGQTRHSTVDRRPRDESSLKLQGNHIYIMVLQGYLFFGTTSNVKESVKRRMEDEDDTRLKYLVLDFAQVSGIDYSAKISFYKIYQMSRLHHFELVFSGLKPGLKKSLFSREPWMDNTEQVRVFDDLDHGLEWCEVQLLHSLHGDETIVGHNGVLQDLFDRLNHESHAEIFSSYLEKVSVPAEHILMQQYERSDELYFVESGEVSIYLDTGNGERIRLRRTEEGTIIGELGFYLHQNRSATVISDKPAELYRLTSAALTRLEKEHPEIALEFHRFMAEFASNRLISLTKTVSQLAQ